MSELDFTKPPQADVVMYEDRYAKGWKDACTDASRYVTRVHMARKEAERMQIPIAFGCTLLGIAMGWFMAIWVYVR